MPKKETPLLFVANWKMNLTLQESVDWCTHNHAQLIELAKPEGIEIVLCPSLPALGPVHQHINLISGVDLGAQNCSVEARGAFTGEVSAAMLAQIGCAYCIVGHSERRTLHGESSYTVAQKAARLLDHDIIPIICIGESQEEFKNNQSIKVLSEQLAPIFEAIQKSKPLKVVFAYEPVWSIGTGKVPEKKYLEDIFAFLADQWHSQNPQAGATMIYGGSVTEENARELASIEGIQGFLIGGASLNFSKFKNIVRLSS